MTKWKELPPIERMIIINDLAKKACEEAFRASFQRESPEIEKGRQKLDIGRKQ